jgi:uncharacterized protein (TIGR03067 family)
MRWHAVLVVMVAALIAADDPKEDAAKKELAKLEGKWSVSTYEREGKTLGAGIARNIKYSFKGDVQTLTGGIGFTGGKEAQIKLDPAKKPAEIDLTPLDGKNKGQTFQGIYKLEGDKLTICVTRPGGGRPKEFATKAGSGTVLVSHERDKK